MTHYYFLREALKHSKYALKLMALCCLMLCSSTVLGQATTQSARTIKGVVTNSSGERLIGMSVIEVGTSNGTTTNTQGEYSIKLTKSANVRLSFSYLGYESQILPVGASNIIDVELKESNSIIDDVVVVGYGTMKKKDVTGSVVSFNADKAAMLPNTNILQALQGAIAGLNVGMTTGAGSTPSYSVRTTTSITADSNPLIVVDGAIYNGSLNDFATSDIQSVDVLKDASALAVYGSRAANGVIIISTKMGSSEKPTISINSYLGVNTNTNKPKMLNGEKYIKKVLDWRVANNLEVDNSKIESYLNLEERENYRNGKTIDPYEEVIQTGFTQNYSASVSGRTTGTNYFAGLNYNSQNGVLKGDDYKRLAMRMNLDSRLTSWLLVGFKANFAKNDYSGVSANLINANYMSPYGSYYDDKGEMIRYPMGDQLVPNPMQDYYQKQDLDVRKSLFGIAYTEIEAPFLKGLKYKISYSHNYRWSSTGSFEGLDTWNGAASKGKGSLSEGAASDYIIDNILSFDKTFASKHYVNATLLYSYEHNGGDSKTLAANTFADTSLGWGKLELGANQSVSSSFYTDNYISQMGRFHYGYDNRYMATFTVRRDGSSRFGAGNKFGVFPSAAVAWTASEEEFVKSIDWISNLKIRTSYGLNGNSAVARYGSLATTGNNRYVDGSTQLITQYIATMENAKLGWESTKTLNFGLDFSVLKSRVSGSFDYFLSRSNDLILSQSLPIMTGYYKVNANIGETKGRGMEITLNSVNIQSRDFNWSTTVNFSRYRNEIVHLYGKYKDGKEEDDRSNSWFIGEPIGVFYGYQTDGIWQIGDDIPSGFKPGFFKIKDIDGKPGISTDDRSVYAYTDPNFRFSIMNNLSYKNIMLSIMINSVQGGNGYYMAENKYALNPNAYFPDRLNMVDMPYWTPENPSNEYPVINYSPGNGHYFLQDRSFVRIQDISIAYNFNKTLLKKAEIKGLKVYASGKNLYTFTKWKGYDPEAGQSVWEGTPSMRTFIFGVELTF